MEKIELLQKGEIATLAEHQKALYILLREFDRVCKALDIQYFLFAGTLLGSVRHKGFIPWDDDLDVIMHRKDYIRFLNEAPKLLDRETFFLQKEFTEHYPMFFSKLHLNGTTCLERFHPKDPKIHLGIYIDIFPYDNAYSSKAGRFLQFAASKIVIAKALGERGLTTKNSLKKLAMSLCKNLPMEPFHKIVRGPNETGAYVHCFLGGASRFSRSVFPSEYFSERIMLSFEEGVFSAPKEYDSLLTILYGDYMTIPSEEDRKSKQHAVLVDLKHSYEFYKEYHEKMEFDSSVASIR